MTPAAALTSGSTAHSAATTRDPWPIATMAPAATAHPSSTHSPASASTATGARRPRRSISTRSFSGTRTRRDTRTGACVRRQNDCRCSPDLCGDGVGVTSPRGRGPSAHGFLSCGPGGPSRGSVEAVKTHGTAGENAALGRGRCAFESLAHHVGRAGEETVGMRIVGRPQDLIGANKVGEYLEAGFNGLERNPAIALKEFGGARLQVGIVEKLIIEMAVHTVEPGRDPAAARFQERDADLRVALANAAPDHRKTSQHHSH